MKGALSPLSAEAKQVEAELSRHVWTLSSAIGARNLTSAPDNLEKAALYIEEEFRKHSYRIERQEFAVEVPQLAGRQIVGGAIVFPSKTYRTRNIIAEKLGHQKPQDILIVGAHYDSVYDCPAANDNGSGVASNFRSSAWCFRSL